MYCKKVRKELSSYLDNEINSRKRQKMEKHLKRCPTCSYQLGQLKKIDILMREIPSQEPEPEFYERLFPRLTEKKISLGERLFGLRHNWQLSLLRTRNIAITVTIALILSLFYLWRSTSLPEVNIEVFQQEYVHYNEMSSFAEELALPVILEIK